MGFKVSRRFRKISGFQDFTIDFGISREISRFHYRFQDFTKDFKISRKISLEVYEISASGGPLGNDTAAVHTVYCMRMRVIKKLRVFVEA